MKKLFLSVVAAIVATTAVNAQSSLLATLSHVETGEISTYYGAGALREAHAAAQEGDIITLSSGSFTSTDITKAVVLRGAGMDVDTSTQSEPTIIVGNFDIKIPATATKALTIEGIYSGYDIYVSDTLTNATFLKDRFKTITYRGTIAVKNLTMIHCKVAGNITTADNSTVSLLNCVVWEPTTRGNWEFTNCVIKKAFVNSYFSNSTFKNCIFVGANNTQFNAANSMFSNVLVTADTSYNFFANITNSTNLVKAYADIFKTCKDGTYSDSETFELTTDAIATIEGTDGTQPGIHGGSMPFSITPSNPQITKANVAAKSTADGKLSVDITVQGAE